MKTLVAALALLVGMNAQARSPQMHVNHTLPHVVAQNQVLEHHVGLIDVNLATQTIEVKIYNDPCGEYLPKEPGTFTCQALAQLVREYQVPLKNRVTGSCGEAIYTGDEDQRPVDGMYTSIELIDNSSNYCEYYAPINAAEVTILQRTPGMGGPVMDLVTKLYTDFTY